MRLHSFLIRNRFLDGGAGGEAPEKTLFRSASLSEIERFKGLTPFKSLLSPPGVGSGYPNTITPTGP
jgi:hypothetical protein